MSAKRIAAILVLASATGAVSRHPAPTRTEIAPGIFLFQTDRYGDVGLDGNSIAIVSSEGVLVFDTNGTPAAASAVLAQIRRSPINRCGTSSIRTGTGTTGTGPRCTPAPFQVSTSFPTKRIER